MKVRIASDLHLDHHRDRGEAFVREISTGNFDVLVLAGDVADFPALSDSLDLICQSVFPKKIVFVCGNHEFYGSDSVQVLVTMLDAEVRHKNLKFLKNDVVEIDGQRFVGSTLWYPIPKVTKSDWDWSDFNQIQDFYKWVHFYAMKSAKYLMESVKEDDVVITHFLPHPGCIAKKFLGDPLNKFFLHDLSHFVEGCGAKLWVHGHMHRSVDMVIGNTRVVCNPLGYISNQEDVNFEFCTDFDIDF